MPPLSLSLGARLMLASHVRKLRCRDSAGRNPGRQDDAQAAQQPPCSAATFRAATTFAVLTILTIMHTLHAKMRAECIPWSLAAQHNTYNEQLWWHSSNEKIWRHSPLSPMPHPPPYPNPVTLRAHPSLSPHSPCRSTRAASHTDLPKVNDVDPVRQHERECQLALHMVDGPTPKPAFDTQAKFSKLAASKSGRVYMLPACLRALQVQAGQDKTSPKYQCLLWDTLRKSITRIVNRVNVTNIKHVMPELFSENLIRGWGLFAWSVMKAQAASLPYTPVFVALVSIINTKLPQVGELVLHRQISQFRKSFKQNDKVCCVLCPLPASQL